MPLPKRMRSAVTVGRSSELATLESALDGVTRGHGGAIFFTGEAGIGKTRLLLEAGRLARERDISILAGAASPHGQSTAFAPITQALRSNLRWRDLPVEPLEAYAVGLHRLIPEWPAPSAVHDMTPAQQRLLAFEACLQLVLHIASRNGAVLALEDLQWLDAESLDTIRHLAPALASAPVVLIGSLRSGENLVIEEVLRTLEARGEAEVIRMQGLDPGAVAELAHSALGQAAPQEVIDDLVSRGDGLPLYVEGLLESHVEQGNLRLLNDRLVWSGVAAGVPRTVRSGVVSKLARLSAGGRRAVSAGAIMRRLDARVIGAVTGLDAGTVGSALREAVEVGLLDLDQGDLGFRHILVTEAVLDNMLPDERRSLHLRSAEVLSAIQGDPDVLDEERAGHLLAAGDRAAGAELLLKVSRSKLARQTPATAEVTLRAALASADQPALRAQCQAALVEALAEQGRWEECLAVDHEVDQAPDPIRLATMARAAAFANRLDLATELLRSARASGAPAPPLMALDALIDLWRGQLAEARRKATAAAAAAAAERDIATECQAMDVLGRAADALGRRPNAAEAFERWIEAATRGGLSMSLIQAHMELGNLDFMSGGTDTGLRSARKIAAEAGAYVSQGLADLSLVWWLGHRGRLEEAIELGEEARELSRRFRLDLAPHANMATGWAMSRREPGGGNTLIDAAVEAMPGDPDIAILASWTRGDDALRLGHAEEAANRYREAAETMRLHPSAVPPPAPFMLVCAVALAGRESEARAALRKARDHPALPRLYVNRTWLLVGEALIERSESSFEAAIAEWNENGSFNQAMALVLAVECIGGPTTGTWLRRALELFELAGASTDAARCRRLMRVRSLPVPRKRQVAITPPGALTSAGLTRRELDVLNLVELGLSNPEIAARLFLSVRTVESHVGSLLHKLELGSRSALVARAWDMRAH